MAQKTVKKTAAKTANTKAATAKKAPVKKAAAAKKPVAKKAVAPEKMVAMPAQDMHTCGCGADCKCGATCGCGADCKCDCHCNEQKPRCGFGRFMKKLIITLIVFALGFAAAKLVCCDKYHMRGPRAEFVNGCLDAASVKCPKLLEALPAMDINQDGCITKDEYKIVKKQMRREIREMDVVVED